MFRVTWTPKSLRDIDRLEEFLQSKSPRAAREAIEAIYTATRTLAEFPHTGRPRDDLDFDDRELIVPFGTGGYAVHYYVLPAGVYILDVRHQRELDR